MPNYPTHARWGHIGAVTVGPLVGGILFWTFGTVLIAAAAAVGAAVATFIGSIYPDVDHHDSVPRRKATRAFRLIVVIGVVSLFSLQFEALVDRVGTITATRNLTVPVPDEVVVGIGTAVTALVGASTVDPAIGLATKQHRAWTHSVPINALLVGILGAAVWFLTGGLAVSHRVAAVAVLVAFLAGTLIHLGLDGEIL